MLRLKIVIFFKSLTFWKTQAGLHSAKQQIYPSYLNSIAAANLRLFLTYSCHKPFLQTLFYSSNLSSTSTAEWARGGSHNTRNCLWRASLGSSVMRSKSQIHSAHLSHFLSFTRGPPVPFCYSADPYWPCTLK